MEQFVSLDIVNRFPQVNIRYYKSGKVVESRKINTRDLIGKLNFTHHTELEGWDEHEWLGTTNLFYNTEMHFRLYLTGDDNVHYQTLYLLVSSDPTSVQTKVY